jgi:hypothetical protein
MRVRRSIRPTNAVSKKVENLAHMERGHARSESRRMIITLEALQATGGLGAR